MNEDAARGASGRRPARGKMWEVRHKDKCCTSDGQQGDADASVGHQDVLEMKGKWTGACRYVRESAGHIFGPSTSAFIYS